MFAIFFILMGFSILAYGFSLAASFALEKAETMKAKHETRVNRLMNKVADIRLSVSFSSLKKRLTTKSSGLDLSGIQLEHSNANNTSNSSTSADRESSEKDEEDEDRAMLRDLENPSDSFSSVSQLSEAYQKSFQYETYKLKKRCIRNLLCICSYMLIASLIMMAQVIHRYIVLKPTNYVSLSLLFIYYRRDGHFLTHSTGLW